MLSLLFNEPVLAFAFLVAILFSLTVHEVAHGAVALYFGDETAKKMGRLSFNPLAHLDFVGAASFLILGFGWGKPVPVNPANFSDVKKGEIFTSLAGPASNFVLAALCAVCIRLFGLGLGSDNLLYIFLQIAFYLNIALMIFNLLPIYPLDGSHLLINLLPDSLWKFKQTVVVYGTQVLFILVLASVVFNINVFGWIYYGYVFFARLFGIPLIL